MNMSHFFNSQHRFCWNALKNSMGFTLIEIILVIVLLGIIGGFTTTYIVDVIQMNSDVSARKDLIDEGKLAMEMIVREVRMGNGVSADGTSITFTKNFVHPQENSTGPITYEENAGNLERQGASTSIVASNVTGFTATANGSFYDISLTLSGGNAGTFTLVSSVRPRSTL